MANETENSLETGQEKGQAQDKEKTVKIDGVSYKLSDLNENARKQMINLRVTDQEIARLNQLLAIAQTARNSYAQNLSEELSKIEQSQTSDAVQ